LNLASVMGTKTLPNDPVPPVSKIVESVNTVSPFRDRRLR
jgi:hypothetical protein